MPKPKVYIVNRDREIIFVRSYLKAPAVEEFLRSMSTDSCILLGTAEGPRGTPMGSYVTPRDTLPRLDGADGGVYKIFHEKALRECLAFWESCLPCTFGTVFIDAVRQHLPKRKTKQLELDL